MTTQELSPAPESQEIIDGAASFNRWREENEALERSIEKLTGKPYVHGEADIDLAQFYLKPQYHRLLNLYRWRVGCSPEELHELALEHKRETSAAVLDLPGRDKLLSEFASLLAERLGFEGVYQRSGMAFIVNKSGDGIELLTAQALRTFTEKYVSCRKVLRDGTSRQTMTESDAVGVLASHHFLAGLPEVVRVNKARMPVFRADGKIELLRNGYDAESKTLTLPTCEYDTRITRLMLPDQVRKVLDSLLSEFCFANDNGRSKAVAISAMLSMYAAGLLPRGALRPVFFYLANAEGAGKTLLAKLAIFPTHGQAEVRTAPRDSEETGKQLLSVVMSGSSYLLFDNYKGHLNDPALEAFTSSTHYKGRILGSNKEFSGEHSTQLFFTGNACTMSPDMRRRSLFVQLKMREERAEDRVFKRQFSDASLQRMRPIILQALYSAVKGWDIAGRPKPSRSNSGFPQWADVMGGIVESAGYSCPLLPAEIEGAADTDGNDMRTLTGPMVAGECYDSKELQDLMREHGLFERLVGDESGGDLKPSERSTLGKILKRYDGRLFANGYFVIEGKSRSKRFSIRKEAESAQVNFDLCKRFT